MNAVEKFNKTLGAMEYNDREEALYSIFRNLKKALDFQEKAKAIERPRYYQNGDTRRFLIEHRNEHLNDVYVELKKLNNISMFVTKQKIFDLPANMLRPYQEDCTEIMNCIKAYIYLSKEVKAMHQADVI